ncbi:MAG: hypothetical protein KA436_02720 [Oligoflexales bacterium]|nr:hypothetical protein [Oligoflexales bacterium]
MKVFCLAHRFYRGKTPPPKLACKACCKIFLSEIKRQHESGEPIPTFSFEKSYAVVAKPKLEKLSELGERKQLWLFT